MQVKKCTTIRAPFDRVWSVVGTRFTEADHWASSVYHSEPRDAGPPPGDAPVSGRGCRTSIGDVRETVLRFDESAGVLQYTAQADKMPGFVRGLVADWKVTPADDERTEVAMTLNVDLAAPFSFMMPPMMRLQMGPLLKKTLQELKHFIEQGTPHPRKLKQLAKAGTQTSAHAA